MSLTDISLNPTLNIDTHLNVRLLLAKIIVNMPQAFEAYANSWVRPLMKLAIEGVLYGDAMSYFVQVSGTP